MDFNFTYTPSRIYRSFELIDHDAHYTVIRFFEENKEEIKGLDFDEYFEIIVAYTHALFHAGMYSKHIYFSDVVIEASIINNVTVFKGINIYEKTLFHKAASYYNLQEYDKSLHILSELIKINPTDPNYRSFFIRNSIQKKPALLQTLQGISISLFFITLLIIALSTFYIEPFRPGWIYEATMVRNVCFISATLLLIGSDAWHRIKAFVLVKNLTKKSKIKMKNS